MLPKIMEEYNDIMKGDNHNSVEYRSKRGGVVVFAPIEIGH